MSLFPDLTSSAIIAVTDIDRARKFYEGVLGLAPLRGMDKVTAYRTGGSEFTVYESDFAGTNKANAVVWEAFEDIGPIVAALSDKGVSFEQYDMPGMEFAGGIHTMGDAQFAWFKDPDGNILHIVKCRQAP